MSSSFQKVVAGSLAVLEPSDSFATPWPSADDPTHHALEAGPFQVAAVHHSYQEADSSAVQAPDSDPAVLGSSAEESSEAYLLAEGKACHLVAIQLVLVLARSRVAFLEALVESLEVENWAFRGRLGALVGSLVGGVACLEYSC